METCKLPEVLRPYRSDDLIRLGRKYDGGYLVNKADVLRAKTLVSLGIENDWSFERDFCRLNDVPMRCFDASVSDASIHSHFRRRRFRLDRPSLIWEAYRNLKSYPSFFDGKHRQHIRKFVGKEGAPDTISLNDAAEYANAIPYFLKIDIEGDEFSILEQIIALASKTMGLAIEIHNLKQNLGTLLHFVNNYPLRLTHTHVNNCAPISPDGLPQLIDLTFSSSANPTKKVSHLPHPLDMSNSPKKNQWAIQFVAEPTPETST